MIKLTWRESLLHFHESPTPIPKNGIRECFECGKEFQTVKRFFEGLNFGWCLIFLGLGGIIFSEHENGLTNIIRALNFTAIGFILVGLAHLDSFLIIRKVWDSKKFRNNELANILMLILLVLPGCLLLCVNYLIQLNLVK